MKKRRLTDHDMTCREYIRKKVNYIRKTKKELQGRFEGFEE